MIARLRGILVERRPDHLVVEVGGVGYRVFVSLNTFYQLPEPGGEVVLLTNTIVRDDAIHLYGFATEAERVSFNHLVAVTGVGPKLAQGILSGIGPDDLWLAVRSRDAERLTKVPGVGKKTAARLVVELEGKIPLSEAAAPEASSAASPASAVAEDALSALMNLGYPEPAAKKAVDAALKETEGARALEELLRLSLRRLSGAGK
jgi:Holliday junction DNA helicase RuvA